MKKRIFTVLVAILTVIPLVLITPKADVQTSTHTVTSYGDYTFQQGMSTTTFNYELPGLPINLTWNSGSYMKLDYNFKDKYSGSMKLTVTSNLDWVLNSSPVYWSISGDGVEAVCYISNTTSMSATGKTKTFSIIFYNCTGIHFEVATGSSATFFTSSNSITISNATFTSQADLNDIYLDMRNFHNSWDLYIPDMSTNLSNISSNTSTMASDIAIIKGFLDGLEGYTDQIEPLLNQLININKINTYPLWQQNFLFWANNYGGLTFDSNLPYFNYYVSNNRGAFYNPYRLKVANGKTLSLIFYSNANINTSNITMYGANASNLNLTGGVSYYVPNYPLYLYRFDFKNNYAGSNFFTIEFDRDMVIYPIYLGGNDLIPDEVHTLLGTDYNNTYTRLLQQISNGVNGVYDTSEYNQYEEIVDNLNDNLLIDVNNSKDNILTDITNQGGNSTDLQLNNVRTAINGLFNDIFTIIPSLKYLVVIGLIILVLGVIL